MPAAPSDPPRPHPPLPKEADLVILGAGPAGIEAALAALEAGYNLMILEAGHVGASLRRWGHVRLFTPWELNVSARGRQALERAGQPIPAGAEYPTGEELVEQYLEPLATTALAGHLHCDTQAVAVSRGPQLKGERIADPARSLSPFRVLWRRGDDEGVLEAPILIDATGVYHTPTATGAGGIPAPGEAHAESRIVRHLPDVLGRDRGALSSGSLLVIGAGYSAATLLHDLAELAQRGQAIPTTWLLRSRDGDPLRVLDDDPLPQRRALTADTNALASSPPPWLRIERGAVVDRFEVTEDGVRVTFTRDGAAGTIDVDRVVSLTGYRPDPSLLRELQVHHCWATDGLMKLSAELLGAQAGGDCMAQGSGGAATLVNPEPNLFVIGNKSYGRLTTYLLRSGREQVDHIFGTLLAPTSKHEGDPS